MSLEDIKRQAEESARRARAELSKAESTVDTQINEAYGFLKAGGVNTDAINVNFENNTFQLTGTVEEGEQLPQLNEVVTNSGSSSTIINNVELEDFTAKNFTYCKN